MILVTPRGETLRGAPDRGRLMVIFCFFLTKSCLLLTKLLADGLVAHSSLVQVYNLFLMSLGRSLVLHMVEIHLFCRQVSFDSVDRCLLILWTGVFYTDNELRF